MASAASARHGAHAHTLAGEDSDQAELTGEQAGAVRRLPVARQMLVARAPNHRQLDLEPTHRLVMHLSMRTERGAPPLRQASNKVWHLEFDLRHHINFIV